MNPVAGGGLPSHMLNEEYVYDGDSVSPVAALAGLTVKSDFLELSTEKNYPTLRERYKTSYDSMKNYLQQPVNPSSSPLTDANKQAMLWKAQAMAHTSDHPGWITANRYDALLRELVQSPELSLKYGIKQRFVERIKRSRKLPVHDSGNKAKVEEGAAALMMDINKQVGVNRESLNKISAYPLEYLEKLTDDDEYLKEVLKTRYTSNRNAEVATTGLIFCGEACNSAVGRGFARAQRVSFIPTLCRLAFGETDESGSSSKVELPKHMTSTHIFIVLMSPEHYKSATDKGLFKEGSYTLLPRGESSETPLLFKEYTCAMSDPWMQQWGLIDEKNWPSMLRSCVQECAGFVEEKSRASLLSGSLSYMVRFKLLY